VSIVWLRRAWADRQKAIDHIARESPRAALGQLDAIERAVDRLAAYPNSARAGRVAGTRELVVGGTPYIVVYRVEQRAVLILRVLHGVQRWPPERESRDTSG